MKTLDKAAVAQSYYESLRANIVQGWEKYVLTDGKNCMFVNRTYQPAQGEAVFYFATRARQTMCQLISINAEEMYTIEPKDGLDWVVRDTIHDITITFTEGLFNETQKVETPTKLTEVEAKNMPRWMREIGDWVAKNHGGIAICDADARNRACDKLGRKEIWILIASALNGFLYEDDISADDVLRSEVEDYVLYDPQMPEALGFKAGDLTRMLETITDDEAKEVIKMTESFWESGRDIEAWATAAALFTTGEDEDADMDLEDK